jgi:hypothetical protein
VSVELIIRLSGVRVPVGPPIKSRGCSNSASTNSAISPLRLRRDYASLLFSSLPIKRVDSIRGGSFLTPRGSYLVLRYCNCSCLDLRRPVLEKSVAGQLSARSGHPDERLFLIRASKIDITKNHKKYPTNAIR